MKTHSTRAARVVALVCLLSASVGGAQDTLVAEPGARLRLTIANGQQRISGNYIRRLTDSLEFEWSDTKWEELRQPIALADIVQMEMSGGLSHPRVKTTLQGAAFGLAFGIVAGHISGIEGCQTKKACYSRGEARFVYGVGLGALGGSIGLWRAWRGFDVWMPATVTGWRR